MSESSEVVFCKECGQQEIFPSGHLTEEGKKSFLCHVCREPVLERKIEEKRRGSRRLLVD